MKWLFYLTSVLTLMMAVLVSCENPEREYLPEQVTISESEISIVNGDSYYLSVAVSPSYAEYDGIVWSSDNESVAAVDEKGRVAAIAPGEATITAKAGDVSGECKVTVLPVGAKYLVLNRESVQIQRKETFTLEAKVIPDNAADKNVQWSSSDDAVASVDASGNVTANVLGNAEIYAVLGELRDTCKVAVVKIHAESVSLDRESLTLSVGASEQLTATVNPEDNDEDIMWSSSDESIATVSDGLVKAIAPGNAEITVQAGPCTAVCRVEVEIPAQVGDYYYSDGTFSTELDKNKTAIGVVFWAGNPGEDDAALRREHPECTHGLVVCIPGYTVMRSAWQKNMIGYHNAMGEQSTPVASWIVENTDDYVTTLASITGEYPDYLNKTMGYNNTKALELFNNAPENSDWKVDAVEVVVNYRNKVKAPESSSDWYLPSAKELSLLCTGEYEGNIWNITNEGSPMSENIELVNSRMVKIPGAGRGIDQFTSYLSSSEYSGAHIFIVDFFMGTVENQGKVASFNQVLPVLAF